MSEKDQQGRESDPPPKESSEDEEEIKGYPLPPHPSSTRKITRIKSAEGRMVCDDNCVMLSHVHEHTHGLELRRPSSALIPMSTPVRTPSRTPTPRTNPQRDLKNQNRLSFSRRISLSLQKLFFGRNRKIAPDQSEEVASSDDDSSLQSLPTPQVWKKNKKSQGINVIITECPHGRQSRTVGWGAQSPKTVACNCESLHRGAHFSSDPDQQSQITVEPSISSISDGSAMGPMHYYAVSGDVASMRRHLEAGVTEIDLPDIDGVTPFMLSVLAGQYKCASLLLKYGASMDASDKNGRTALHWVVYNGLEKGLKWLLKHGADWRKVDCASRTALHWSTDCSDPSCLAVLLKHIPISYVNEKDGQGMTALAWACNHNHVEHAKLLLKRGARTTLANHTGATPAHFAASQVNPDCIQLLLRHDPLCCTYQDEEGRTPLHIACTHGSLITARIVMDTYLAAWSGLRAPSPLPMAGSPLNPRRQVAPLPSFPSSSSSSSPSPNNILNDTPRSHYLVVQDSRRRTPLHCAAVAGRAQIAKELLSRGHPPDCIDDDGHMPIWYARVKQHDETVKLIASFIVHLHKSKQNLGQNKILVPREDSPLSSSSSS